MYKVPVVNVSVTALGVGYKWTSHRMESLTVVHHITDTADLLSSFYPLHIIINQIVCPLG